MFDGVVNGMIIGGIIGMVVAVTMGIIAATRKASLDIIAKPWSRRTEISVRLPGRQVYDIIVAASQDGVYRFGVGDPSAGALVLERKMTLFSNGFFHPVAIAGVGDVTTVAVGSKSRLFQWGPVVSQHHQKFCDWITGVLQSAESANTGSSVSPVPPGL